VPTYAYACKDCDHEFDIVQSFSDDSLTICPECEGALRKKFNSVGVVFKGSGFYRTDSRSDGAGLKGGGASTAASSNGSDSSNGSSNGSTGSDGSGSSSSAEKKSDSSGSGSGSSSSGSAGSGSNGSSPAKTPATTSA
jgi:putative FmdB family regulatory protein